MGGLPDDLGIAGRLLGFRSGIAGGFLCGLVGSRAAPRRERRVLTDKQRLKPLASLDRNRGFESASLQRKVRSENHGAAEVRRRSRMARYGCRWGPARPASGSSNPRAQWGPTIAAHQGALPVTEPMLDEVIAFLNDKNREYAEGEADYNWSVWADNCSHTLRNALAAANIWSPLSVRAVKFRQLFNLAVPANEFVNLAELGTEGNIDDYREIQQDGPRARRAP